MCFNTANANESNFDNIDLQSFSTQPLMSRESESSTVPERRAGCGLCRLIDKILDKAFKCKQ